MTKPSRAGSNGCADAHWSRGWWAPGLTIAAVLCAAPASASAEIRSVTVTSANFRAGPSTDDPVIFTADRHFPVEIVESAAGWVRIRDFEGEEAWVLAALLGEAPTVVVNDDVVNVRDKPELESTVVHTAERGAVFRVIRRHGPWVRVADDLGEIGWVHEKLLWGNLGPSQ